MSRQPRRLAEKVEDLASTLNATTDMLSTADRMLGHYRDVNKEQELEISRLRTELVRPPSPPAGRRSRLNGTRSSSKERGRQRSTHIQFSDEDTEPETEFEEFERSMKDLNKKQEKLRQELKRDRLQRTDDMHEIGSAFQKVDEKLLDRQLSEIKDQLSSTKTKWDQQQSNLDKIAQDLNTVKGLIHESTENKSKEKEDSLRNIVQEIELQRERAREDSAVINDLQSRLKQKDDAHSLLKARLSAQSTEHELKKERFLQRLEELHSKLDLEHQERKKLQEELTSVRTQTTTERDDLANQLARLKSEALSISSMEQQEVTKKLESIERKREQLTERLNIANEDCQKKEAIIEKLKTQMLELTKRFEESEHEKRRYMTELENALSKLKETTKLLETTKFALQRAEKEVKDSEDKRADLKSRAVEAIKEYRAKCRDLEKDRAQLTDKTEKLHFDLTKLTTERNELERECSQAEKSLTDARGHIEKLEQERSHYQTQVSQLQYEKSQLEEALAVSSEQKAEITRLQREISDFQLLKQTLTTQVNEEVSKRKEQEDRLQDYRMREKEAKEDITSLARQLQEEQSSHAKSMKLLEDQLQRISAEEERLSRELNDKANMERSRYEHEIMSLKNQLEEERTKIRNQRELHGTEREKIKSDLEKANEENRKIRKRYQIIRRDLEEKNQKPKDTGDSYSRVSELGAELRRNQETLLCTREAYQQTLRNINMEMENLVDCAIEDADDTIPVRGMRDFENTDPRKMSHEILERIRKCRTAFLSLRDEQEANRQHLKKAQERIQDLVRSANQEKSYLVHETEKQNELVATLELQKRNLEVKLKDANENVLMLTRQLEKSTRVLHAGAEALEDKTRVLEELDDLEFEQKERDKVNENYIKYKERIGSLQRQIQDAKTSLYGLQEQKAELDSFSGRLEESFHEFTPKTASITKQRIAKPKSSFVEPATKAFDFSTPSLIDEILELETPSPRKKRKEKSSSSKRR